jgi:hypothetical protein
MGNYRAVLYIVLALALGALTIYECHYSAEMQTHIDRVNRDLEDASIRSIGSTGLLGSLQTMRDEADVAGEIMETRLYVHTLRDELLARRIRQAAEDGVTVGGAIGNVVHAWPDSI